MATNIELIRDALGLVGILNELQQPSANQSDHGLRILNEMLEEWASDGINVGQWPQTDVDAESPVPLGTIPAVKYNLAAALGPYYGVSLSPADTQRAERFYGRLVRDTVLANRVEADLTGKVPGSVEYSNILTG